MSLYIIKHGLPIQKIFSPIFSFSFEYFFLKYKNFFCGVFFINFPFLNISIIFKRAKSSCSFFSIVIVLTISPSGNIYILSLFFSSSKGGAAWEHVKIYPFLFIQTAVPNSSEILQRQLPFTFSKISLYNLTVFASPL